MPAHTPEIPSSPTDCESAVRRLWDYLDGRLPAMTNADVESHLASCELCPPHFAFARSMREALATSSKPLTSGDESRMRLRVRDALARVASNEADDVKRPGAGA